MLIYEGMKVYRLSKLIIYEYEVTSFTKKEVCLKRVALLSEDTPKKVIVNYNLFQANYMIGKIPLLKTLLSKLEKYIENVAVEINEYEFQCILNKYVNK